MTCLSNSFNWNFDEIELDFIIGKKFSFIKITLRFDQNKILFAGVVNGKNIWKNEYEKQFL